MSVLSTEEQSLAALPAMRQLLKSVQGSPGARSPALEELLLLSDQLRVTVLPPDLVALAGNNGHGRTVFLPFCSALSLVSLRSASKAALAAVAGKPDGVARKTYPRAYDWLPLPVPSPFARLWFCEKVTCSVASWKVDDMYDFRHGIVSLVAGTYDDGNGGQRVGSKMGAPEKCPFFSQKTSASEPMMKCHE